MRWLAGVYVLIVTACVFFRIEFWPLSDFRMFAQALKPEDKTVFRLAIDVSGSERWLFEGEEVRRNNRVDHVFQMASVGRGEIPREALERILKDHHRVACTRKASRIRLYRFDFACPEGRCQDVEIQRRVLGEQEVECR